MADLFLEKLAKSWVSSKLKQTPLPDLAQQLHFSEVQLKAVVSDFNTDETEIEKLLINLKNLTKKQ